MGTHIQYIYASISVVRLKPCHVAIYIMKVYRLLTSPHKWNLNAGETCCKGRSRCPRAGVNYVGMSIAEDCSVDRAKDGIMVSVAYYSASLVEAQRPRPEAAHFLILMIPNSFPDFMCCVARRSPA